MQSWTPDCSAQQPLLCLVQFDKVLSGSLSAAVRSLVRAVEQFGGIPPAAHRQVTCRSHACLSAIGRHPPTAPAPAGCDWCSTSQQGVLPFGTDAHAFLCAAESGTCGVSRLGGGEGGCCTALVLLCLQGLRPQGSPPCWSRCEPWVW